MAITTQQLRPAPWAFWATWDLADTGPNAGSPVTLYSLRCWNTSSVAVRIKVTLGRGASTTEQAQIVQPGEDVTRDFSASPVNLRNVDYGVAIEQV